MTTTTKDPLAHISDHTVREYLRRYYLLGTRRDGSPIMRWDTDAWAHGLGADPDMVSMLQDLIGGKR